MGRAERRKFFRDHPYCQVCEKMRRRTRSTLIMTPGIAVCDQCAANIASLRAKQQEILDKKKDDVIVVDEEAQADEQNY